jgi:hypothetical protein
VSVSVTTVVVVVVTKLSDTVSVVIPDVGPLAFGCYMYVTNGADSVLLELELEDTVLLHTH